MPAGVEVVVDDGFATIDFVDRKLRGPGIARLLEAGGPETIEKLTGGLRAVYRVPEGNAREAGLLDEPALGAVVHVSEDGTETPSVPDADGMHTLVSTGGFAAGGLLPPGFVLDFDPHSVLLTPLPDVNEPAAPANTDGEPPAGTPLTQEELAAASAAAAVPDNGGQPEPAAAEWPEGEPSDEWSLPELKAYAGNKGIDAHELRSKAKVLALINAAS